ncbi:endothelin-converting enzyme homolog isoform X2 [Ornithodoros turicata]|uniref:endothelin-converting enzyme homolog isoform X2 n=1 Tax=Ornithodoros turicata TaxID=34597 RepID=UPI0031386D77
MIFSVTAHVDEVPAADIAVHHSASGWKSSELRPTHRRANGIRPAGGQNENMNGIQLKPMPRYMRTEFDDEETSSASSVPVDASVTGSSTLLTDAKAGRGPPPAPLGVRYSVSGASRHRRGFWQRLSPLERFLLVLVGLLAFVVFVLSIVVSVNTGTVRERIIESYKAPVESKYPAADDDAPLVVMCLLYFSEYCVTPACVTVASSILNAIDLEADPCEDFYQYSCGGWIKSNPLPDGKSIWGTFGKLWQENQLVMKNVLEDEKTDTKSEAERKARIYYHSCLDKNDTIEALGSQPIINVLNIVGGWNISGNYSMDDWDLEHALRLIHNVYSRSGLFSWAVGEDERNSSRHILQVDQGGLLLPSRDYYLNKSADDKVLTAYHLYMTTVGVLLGGDEASVKSQMEGVIEFEKALAKITIPAEERRDDEQLYHKMTIEQLQGIAPFINWTRYFDIAFSQINKTISSKQEVVVYAPEYMSNMSSLVREYMSTENGKVVICNYLGWSLVHSMVSYLSEPFREASKVLRKALMGSDGSDTTWRYCVTDTNTVIGFALGAMFVREVFDGDSKPLAQNMIQEVKDAFKNNLPLLKWMDPETRELAKEKADAINNMIGFPDFITNPKKLDEKYKGLEFMENEYFENNIRVSQFLLRKNMLRLYRPTNKTEWEMTPTTVNAYYTPTKNQIVFPAGILQAPFYDPNYPKSLNFGAMGVVMGHELTHAFDDQGREYDKTGNLHQWWKNATIQSFQSRAQCFVDQYSNYSINNENLNGKQTLGENIADNGGLKAAFHAFEDWLQAHPDELPLPGVNLTHKQLFYVGFAQVWCSTETPEAIHLQILSDPHSPAKYRVVGTVSNSDEFAREFRCRKSRPMNPKKKCEVW